MKLSLNTIEAKEKMSKNNGMKRAEVRMKCKGNTGKRYPYKPRPKAKGRLVWNKGLTKETDERVRLTGIHESITKSQMRGL